MIFAHLEDVIPERITFDECLHPATGGAGCPRAVVSPTRRFRDREQSLRKRPRISKRCTRLAQHPRMHTTDGSGQPCRPLPRRRPSRRPATWRAAGANIARPAANPFTDAWRAAAARLSATVSSLPPRSEATIPLHQRSFRSTVSQIVAQPASFHIGFQLPPVRPHPEVMEALDDFGGSVVFHRPDGGGVQLQ